MRYIALLRGINVGGINKVPMAELKLCLESAGFTNVRTYINSGNVFFDTTEASKIELISQCEHAIEKQFGFYIICSIIQADELKAAVAHAPSWWGEDPLSSHNARFAIAPATPETIMDEIGDTNPEIERFSLHGAVIFWSAPVKTFSRTRLSKIVGTPVYRSITIRNANTTKKLVDLSK
jgi:uncharacterized protein (DUF1697 family)